MAFLAPIGRGILVFVIFGMALYAYAVTFPGTEPAPASGVVGLFVGLTEGGGYIGGDEGYEDLNRKCATGQINSHLSPDPISNVGAHVCTADEIINSINNNATAVMLQDTGTGIINNGPPGYVVFANECNGWQVTSRKYQSTPAFGTVWSFDSGSASLATCDAIHNNNLVKVACCK